MRETNRKLRDLLSPREQRRTALLFVLLVIGAALEMVSVSAIPAFVALLSAPRRLLTTVPAAFADRIPTNASDATLVLYAAFGLLGISIVKNGYLAGVAFLQGRYVFGCQTSLSARLLQAYLRAPYQFHLRRNTAELLRNVNQEAVDVVGAVVLPILVLTLEGLTIAAIMAVLLAREPLISLLAFGLLGGTTWLFIRVIRTRLMSHGEAMQRRRTRMIQIVNESLGGIKITKVLGRERQFGDAFAREAMHFGEAAQFRQIAVDLPRLYLETAAIFGLLGIAALLLAQHRPSQAIIPVLSLFAVAIVRMVPSFNKVTGSLTALRYGQLSLRVVHADLRALGSADATHGAQGATVTFDREIQFDDVTFRYPEVERPSLDRVSLRIKKGSVVALVGPTGSGKTTLVDLILGLHTPSAGRILVDGRDVRTNAPSWQRQIGYVPQDVFLTDDSIRRNIALGLEDTDIDEAAVGRAVEAAQLAEFTTSLPAGLNTVVGERGVRLSGGQRQRIGIARALYTDPEILVLDEATSSLDNATERFVMQAVECLRGERTIIMVAHRLTTVRGCDVLFLLDAGKVAGSGSYEELVKDSQHFRRMATTASH